MTDVYTIAVETGDPDALRDQIHDFIAAEGNTVVSIVVGPATTTYAVEGFDIETDDVFSVAVEATSDPAARAQVESETMRVTRVRRLW